VDLPAEVDSPIRVRQGLGAMPIPLVALPPCFPVLPIVAMPPEALDYQGEV